MDKKYIPTIGLEIHAELKTLTKMFCACKNNADENRPNVNICPICMGHPGTLPVINKQAVKNVLKVGLAINGELAYNFTEFDRKNYFYPDIPKSYQLSQYKFPLVKGGMLNGIAITRIHLEEDTASSSHDQGGTTEGYSLVDFNRAGVPLMELVTEPVIHDAETASSFARELQLLLRYLGVGEANMEKGEMRVEANISVAREGEKLGTKVEVKNLNSFKTVEKAIAYEIDRHISLLESGGKIVQETRGWDENKGATYSQRVKEDSHDYRYFPDPDLPKLRLKEVAEFAKEILEKELPELPWERRSRYISSFELKPEDAEIYVRSVVWGEYFEKTIADFKDDKKLVKLASNYLVSDLAGLIRKETPDADAGLEKFATKAEPVQFAKLIRLIENNTVSSRGAKDVLAVLFAEGGDPETIANEKGLVQKSDPEALNKIVDEIIAAHASVVADFKSGKTSALQFLVGQGMKASKGSANPAILRELFVKKLV